MKIIKQKIKRIISAFLALSVIFLALIFTPSCNSGKQNNNLSGEQNEQKQNQDQQQQSVEEQDNRPEFTPVDGLDYDGYKFRILGFDGKANAWQAVSISEIIAEEEIGEPIHDAIYRRNNEIEELYNIKIDIVPVTYPNRDDFARIASKAILAGDDVFDTAFLLGSAIPTVLGKKNMAHDLTAIPSLDLSKSWWDQNSRDALSVGNKLTMVIGDVNLYSSFAPMVIYANKQIIEEYSVGNLYQLVRDGEWTWDALYDIARMTAKDLDGDGVIKKDDQIGFSLEATHLYVATNSAGGFMTPKNNGDIPELAPNIEKISSVIDKVLPIFKDTSTSLFGNSITGYDNPYFEFLVPKFRNGGIMFLVQQLLISFELRSMEADFAILPFPKYDEAQENYGSVITNAFATYTVIPITCGDTERTANILQAMGYYSQKYITPAYYDVTVTNKLIRDDDTIEMLDIILRNRVFDLAFLYDWGGIAGIFESIALKKDAANTFVSLLEKNEAKIKAAIQNTLSELE